MHTKRCSVKRVQKLEAELNKLESEAELSGLKINFGKSRFGAVGISDQWKHDAAKYLNCSCLTLLFGLLMQQNGELWTRVLNSKYGGWRNLEETGNSAKQCVWWRDVKQAFNQSHQGLVIQNNMRWKVGDGEKVRFWTDKWINQEESLAERYPRLFIISSQQNHTIRQMRTQNDTGWEWNCSWRRLLFDNEIDTAISFLREIHQGHTDHLFIHCNKIQPIWWESMSWMNIKGTFPFSSKQHFMQHISIQMEGLRAKRWRYWWLPVTWSIWKHKNRIFDKRGFSHWWRDIRNLYHQSNCSIFKDNLAWKVGSGENIKFWTDKWLGEQHTLQQKYNQLFLISRQQKDHISLMGHFNHNSWRWDMRWRRNLFDHESHLAVHFMEEISSVPIQRQVKDNMLWLAESNGQYTTRSAYSLCMNTTSVYSDGNIFKTIWQLKIPPRAVIFCWRLLKNRLPTKVNLLRRNAITQEDTCSLCADKWPVVGIYALVRVVGPLSITPVHHFYQFCDGFGANVNHSTRCGWWVALTSSIWQHRNHLIFQGKTFDPCKVMDHAIFLAWSWLKAKDKNFSTTFHYWSSNISNFLA
ncbi:hypothetical protein HKD37_15G043772 [Glycine soja]